LFACKTVLLGVCAGVTLKLFDNIMESMLIPEEGIDTDSETSNSFKLTPANSPRNKILH
jgi:hypothetical protein